MSAKNRNKPIVIGIIIGLVVGFAMGFGMVGMNQDDGGVSGIMLSSETTNMVPQLNGEVTIGALLPLTGDLSTHGEESLVGANLAIADFNNYLETLDANWHLRLVNEDSATSPVIALEKLTSLHSRNINVIVGPQSSAEVRNIKGYSDSNNMLLVSPSSTAPALAIPNDSVYRLIPDDSKQGPGIAKIMQHAGIEILVPVWRGDAWGDGLSKSATDSFAQLGGAIGDGIRYNPESPEFSASISLLSEQVQGYADEYGADKVGVLIISFAEIVQLTQSASEHEILDDVRWFGSDGNTKEDKLIQDPIALSFSQKTQFTSTQTATNFNSIHKHVNDAINDELGRTPNSYAFSSYDAVWLVGLAIQQTQSTDVSTIKEAIPHIAKHYYGAIGHAQLNDAGDLAQADYDIWSIKNDEWVLIGKYVSTTDSISKI